MTAENHEWLKRNIPLLLDENIKPSLKGYLIKKGYNVSLVLDLFGKGTPDHVILELLKTNKFLFVTCDYRFYKMLRKYNQNKVIYIEKEYENKRYTSLVNFIQDELAKRYKELKQIYLNEENLKIE